MSGEPARAPDGGLAQPPDAATAARAALDAEATRRSLASGRLARGAVWVWASILGASLAGAVGGLALGAVALLVGAALGVRGERRWAERMAHRALAGSFASLSLGRLVEAEATLGALEASAWLPGRSRRLIAIQRGLVAVRRGDWAEATRALDAAIAAPPTRGEPDARYQITGALALRAFVHAAEGRGDQAMADVASVRAAGDAADDALARASLAEALCLERAGERAALGELLARDRRLLRAGCHPRERAIVRALERSLRTPRTTPYRVAEAPAVTADEPSTRDWLARVAPQLAALAPRARRTAPEQGRAPALLAPPAPPAEDVAAVQERRGARSAWWGPLVAAAVVLGGLWVVASGAPSLARTAEPGGAADGDAPLVALAALAVLLGSVAAGRWWRRRRDRARIGVARADAARKEELTQLAASPDPAVAAQASLLLAVAAEIDGRFADVLEHTERGLSRLPGPGHPKPTGLLVPDLVSLRALALSALDRHAEAEAELSTIAAGYPHFPLARFRAGLVRAARRGQLAEALSSSDAVAEDLPLSVREELLVDLVRAVAPGPGVSVAESQRIAAELEDEEMRRWIAAAAPQLLAAFEGEEGAAPDGPRIAATPHAEAAQTAAGSLPREVGAPDDAEAAQAEAQREATAEEEAHQGSSSASMARATS